jgi:hypothetical protein
VVVGAEAGEASVAVVEGVALIPVEEGARTVAVVVVEVPMVAEALPLTAATTKFFTQTPEPAWIFLAGFCIYLLTSSTPAASLPSPASPALSSAA